MAFVRFDKNNHFSLDHSQVVSQDEMEVKFFAKNDQDILLHFEGLNPCVGLIFYGEASMIDPSSGETETKYFVAGLHHSGFTEQLSKAVSDQDPFIQNEFQKQRIEFCQQGISDLLAQIESVADTEEILKINLKAIFLLRCKQLNPNNSQEKFAETMKEILSERKFAELIEAEDLFQDIIFEFDHCAFQHKELLEHERNNESDALHVLVKPENETINIIFYKGFKTLDELFEKEEQQKRKSPTQFFDNKLDLPSQNPNSSAPNIENNITDTKVTRTPKKERNM